jgi:glycosyltransferase involved in cell wall biosynthesis
MRILVLAPQWPDPPRQGAAIRNLQVLLHLARRHEVYLLTFASDGPMEMQRLREACVLAEVLPRPTRSSVLRLQQLATTRLPDMAWRLHSAEMLQRVTQLCQEVPFDAVHIEGIEMATYGLLAARFRIGDVGMWTEEARPDSFGGYSTQLRKLESPTPSLTYDAHNAEYVLQRRAFTTDIGNPARLPQALYSLVQWWRLRRFERRVCIASRHVLAVSEADRKALALRAPDKAAAMRVLPNGVDPDYWSRDADFPKAKIPASVEALVFDGTMDYRPNVDAAVWFVKNVLPLVRADRPSARFYIVGRNPSPEVASLAALPGVTVTGAVPDTRGWVAGASVYVMPMRMGGGVRLKVLQAMAMGCAIVSTPMGVEGIFLRPNKDAMLARTPIDFALNILTLLHDPAQRAELGTSARERALDRYTWDKLLPTLDEVYLS